MDTLSPAERSARMGAIRNKHTKPEMVVRRLVHGLGYRYRLHRKGLPGRPDIVFPARRKAIFVHGCFWHRHRCALGRLPKSNQQFWLPKLEGNRVRDKAAAKALSALGWRYLVLWECQLRDRAALTARVAQFLEGKQQ